MDVFDLDQALVEEYTRFSRSFTQIRAQDIASQVNAIYATRLGTLDASHMPKVAGRPLRHASCCFPHASPVSEPRAGKQKTALKDRSKQLLFLRKFGAGEGIRTLDPNLGKVVP